MIVRRGNRRILDVDTFDLGPVTVEALTTRGYSGSLAVPMSEIVAHRLSQRQYRARLRGEAPNEGMPSVSSTVAA